MRTLARIMLLLLAVDFHVYRPILRAPLRRSLGIR